MDHADVGTDPAQTGPIDAVITWVDGAASDDERLRAQVAAEAGGALHENAVNPHRWTDNREIDYCLRSIASHAPWVRWIWIVVAAGPGPDVARLPEGLRGKVRIVPHTAIFAGFEGCLPTFNSLAIESVMWRIEGLSERFLYFNDDVFLTAPLRTQEVFDGIKPVLRGRWVDYGGLDSGAGARSDPAKFHDFMQVNAARLTGLGPSRLFAAAHVVHPMRRSVMADLFARLRPAFAANVSHRFRDLSQFLPQGLHNHACIAAGQAVTQTRVDHLHIWSGQGTVPGDPDPRALLAGMQDAGVKFLCVNDLPQLEELVPDARAWIAAAVSPHR